MLGAGQMTTDCAVLLVAHCADKHAKGYVISWLNHSVLIVYLIPWAIIVGTLRC